MANPDTPNGFQFETSVVGHAELVKGSRVGSGAAIAKGDALEVGGTAGTVKIGLSTSGQLMGISAMDLATSTAAADIWFYPGWPWLLFSGQASGTWATTEIYTACDIEGTTGIMEVNEDAATESVIFQVGYKDDTAVGANTRVVFYILRSAYYPVLAAL